MRYDAVNAMLLNEFLKERHRADAQAATIADLQAALTALSARVDANAPGARLPSGGQ